MRKISAYFLFFFTLSSFSQTLPTATPTLPLNKPPFDVKVANAQFDKLNLKLSTNGQNANLLKSAIKALKDLMGNADDCIKTNEKKLSSIDSQIQETNPNNEKVDIANTSSKSEADLVYLAKERKSLSSKLAQCRLFFIRAKEAIEVYEANLSKMKKDEILAKGEPIWVIVDNFITNEAATIKILPSIFNIPTKITNLSNIGLIFALSFLLSGVIFYSAYNSKKTRQYLHLRKIHYLSFFILSFSIASLCITSFLTFIFYTQQNVSSLILNFSIIITCYLFSVFLISLTFNIKKIKAFFCWYSLDSHFFKSLIIFLFSLYTIAFGVKTLGENINFNEAIWLLGQSIFLYTEIFLAIGFVYYFCYSHRQISFIKKHNKPIKFFSTIIFISCAILNIFGYHSLSIHLTFSGITTFAIIFGTILLEQAIGKLYTLCSSKGPMRVKIITIFGYKPDQTFAEILILKTTIQLITLIYATYLISRCWEFTSNRIETTFAYLIEGIKFETFTFHPTRIISGITVFCVMYLIFKSISTAITRHKQFDGEEETQVAVASILTYIGFTISVVSGLLVSGFDFTGLAIIAGALSVGIGLGLQSIVNNFVSGIILLIEKPIKPGDRINVDGIEGYVQKIRVRSTQLLTPTREDMIIPNSDLITRRVTNYMYGDKYLTIYCEIGIAYGSDINLAKELLIDIASKHPEVLTNIKNNKPRVFFRTFGENSMLFQLWFLIKDGNKKVLVKSEMNFAIEKAFRENNIVVAYPQRDINIKLSDIDALKQQM